MDNKKSYSKPFMMLEKFVAHDFVAACDIPGDYYFQAYNGGYWIWLESNGIDGVQAETGVGYDTPILPSARIYFDSYTNYQENSSYDKYVVNNYVIVGSEAVLPIVRNTFYYKKNQTPKKATKNNS